MNSSTFTSFRAFAFSSFSSLITSLTFLLPTKPSYKKKTNHLIKISFIELDFSSI